MTGSSGDKFIDDSNQKEDEDLPRFYGFVNQTRDPGEALNGDDKYKPDIHASNLKFFIT